MKIALFLVAWGGSLYSQTLTLDQAIAAGLAHNPRIGVAQKDLEAADARVKIIRADLYPKLTFSGIAKAGLSGATNALGLVGLPNSPFYRNFAASLNLTQTVFDFGRRAAAIDVERRNRDAIAADLAFAKASVSIQVERSYLRLLRAQTLSTVGAELLNAREGAFRKAQIFYEAQYSSRIPVDEAQLQLASTRRVVREQELEVQRYSVELGAAMGTLNFALYNLAQPAVDKQLPGTVQESIEAALANRPDLQALHARRRGAEANIRLARSLRMPSLSLALTGGYARFSSLLLRELTAAGAGVTAPLYTGGSIDGQIALAEALAGALAGQEKATRQKITVEVSQAYLEHNSRMDVLMDLQARDALERSRLGLAREQYVEGLSSGVDFKAVQALSSDATIKVRAAEMDIQLAVADIQFVTGTLK